MSTAAASAEQPHKERSTTIVVNGREKTVTSKEISFEELLELAFENPPTGDNWFFTVVYRRGEGNKPSGTLAPGESVKVKDRMIFDVTATDKS